MVLSSTTYPLTIEGNTLGQPVRFCLPRREKKLTISYVCGGSRGVIARDTAQEEILWTPPETLGAEYPQKTGIPVTLVLEAGGAQRMEWMELALPPDGPPELQVTLEEEQGRDSFVQNVSRLRVQARAEGKYGAQIRSVRVSCGSLTGAGQNLIFDLPRAGEIPVAVRAEDSRGAESRWEGTLRVHPYTPPRGGFQNIREENGHLLGSAWANAGEYPICGDLILKQGGKQTRQALGTGLELEGNVDFSLAEGGWTLEMELQNGLETVVIPCVREPLLDVDPEARALGIGCRGDRTGTVSLKLPVNLQGNPLTGLGQAQSSDEALPLGQGDGRYLRPRLLWENPSPKQPFPAGSVKAEGNFFLIGAAQRADAEELCWDLCCPGGILRGESPRPVAYEKGMLRFGTTAKGDGYSIPRKIYTLF